MHSTHLLGGGLLIAVLGWFAARHDAAAVPPAPPLPPAPPTAAGHYALVVQGDRDQLAITHAVAKPDPWAGVPKGLDSPWLLRVWQADQLLAEVPLDLTPFDTRPDRKGGAVRVEGCIVQDPKVALLVNAPRFAGATAWTFVRRDGDREVRLGGQTGDQVRALAGGGR
ncbi:MAG: hypothetical protein JNL08_07770 [Planctomycetes bacterium]|nr:hypothetical protein [Planctomycetota bacterium]